MRIWEEKMKKEYTLLFQDDPDMLERAKGLAKRVRGFSEFLLDRMPASIPANAVSGKVTYHDPCHMSRYQGVVKQPRALLKKIPGLTYTELPEADLCCGAAGSYNVLHYEQSMRVLDRKMKNLQKIGADILTTECPGCIIQLSYGARRACLGVRVIHISELIQQVFQSAFPGTGKN
jgi:glycolate oxidase iron-sulfur subunit